jgi:hypothetical protein
VENANQQEGSDDDEQQEQEGSDDNEQQEQEKDKGKGKESEGTVWNRDGGWQRDQDDRPTDEDTDIYV